MQRFCSSRTGADIKLGRIALHLLANHGEKCNLGSLLARNGSAQNYHQNPYKRMNTLSCTMRVQNMTQNTPQTKAICGKQLHYHELSLVTLRRPLKSTLSKPDPMADENVDVTAGGGAPAPPKQGGWSEEGPRSGRCVVISSDTRKPERNGRGKAAKRTVTVKKGGKKTQALMGMTRPVKEMRISAEGRRQREAEKDTDSEIETVLERDGSQPRRRRKRKEKEKYRGKQKRK